MPKHTQRRTFFFGLMTGACLVFFIVFLQDGGWLPARLTPRTLELCPPQTYMEECETLVAELKSYDPGDPHRKAMWDTLVRYGFLYIGGFLISSPDDPNAGFTDNRDVIVTLAHDVATHEDPAIRLVTTVHELCHTLETGLLALGAGRTNARLLGRSHEFGINALYPFYKISWENQYTMNAQSKTGPHFVTQYARSSASEDFCETMAYVLVLPEKTARLALQSHLIAAKVRFVEEVLSKKYDNFDKMRLALLEEARALAQGRAAAPPEPATVDNSPFPDTLDPSLTPEMIAILQDLHARRIVSTEDIAHMTANEYLTLSQAAQAIARTFNLSSRGSRFVDIPDGTEALYALQDSGLVTLKPNGSFGAQRPIAAKQFVEMLTSFVSLPPLQNTEGIASPAAYSLKQLQHAGLVQEGDIADLASVVHRTAAYQIMQRVAAQYM